MPWSPLVRILLVNALMATAALILWMAPTQQPGSEGREPGGRKRLTGTTTSELDPSFARLFMDSPTLSLSTATATADELDPDCTHFSCVDVSRCGFSHDLVLVHVPSRVRHVDEEGSEVAPLSREFLELLQAVSDSPHHTADPGEACLFLPPVDLLNLAGLDPRGVGRALASSRLWNGGGNHVAFTMLPGRSSPPKVGRAMLAAAGMTARTYRRGFDVSIPTLSPSVQSIIPSVSSLSYPNQTLLPTTSGLSEREWLVVALPPVRESLLPVLKQLEAEHPQKVLVLEDCGDSASGVRRCSGGKRRHDYAAVLQRATFCLVLPGTDGTLAHGALVEAMHFGCLPVVVSGESAVLPFSEKLDWPRFSVSLRSHELPEAVELLESVSPEKAADMRRRLDVLYGRHFR